MSQVLSVSFLWFLFFWLCGLLLLRRLFYFRPLIFFVLPFVYITVLRSFCVVFFHERLDSYDFLYYTFYPWYIMNYFLIEMQATASLRPHVGFAAACSLRVLSLTFPRLLVLLRLPHPTNQVSCLSIKHFFQVSNADNCQVCRTQGRSCAGPQTMFDIFLKEFGTLFVGRHKTGPCEAAEDGVAIF